MFTYFVDEEARDILGNGWGGELEREAAKLAGGSLSAVLGYHHFSRSRANFDNSLNYYTFGLKMRWGAGAFGNQDGIYYGIGGNVAILSSRLEDQDRLEESERGHHTVTGGEALALLGANFAKSWYAEASYRVPTNLEHVNTNNADFVLGYRF